MRIAVIGHVEHVTIGTIPALPAAGDIVHLAAQRTFPGGGGGVAFYQLVKSSAQVLLFTAIGEDDAGATIATELDTVRARVHAARRHAPHTRDLVLVTPDGQRTIVVIGEPQHPRATDPLPWSELAGCDAVYFTAQDPDVLVRARDARMLVVTARRREALIRSGVRADVVVGSAGDPREASVLADYPVAPGALVMTEGAHGGTVATAAGVARFVASKAPDPIVGSYGAGDSFAAALTYFLASGLDPLVAAGRAAAYGAAVLAGLVPLDVQAALP